ncbi:hypothetical protein AB0D00_26400 [Streptomyces sp. NPDC048213]|uniref:hypothetical protein n=1 Tax=Streptomyces sp. NPDC048213 TaxID=3160984 RepID=UPI0033F01D90
MIRCEVRAHTLDLARSWTLRLYEGPTPRTALRWMGWQAGKLADQLDPHPWSTPWLPRGALVAVGLAVPDAPAYLRAWRDDLDAHSALMTVLLGGDPVSVSAYDDTAYYTITAFPERFSVTPGPPPVSRYQADLAEGRLTTTLPASATGRSG